MRNGIVSMWSYRCLRWALGSVFIYSGVTKMVAPQPFAVLIEAFGLVPEILVMPVALMLPVVEMVAGIGLLADVRGSLAAIAGLLVLFAGILGFGIRMGLDVDCGCFGPGDPEAEAFHGLRTALYRDLLMLAVVGFLYAWRRFHNMRPRRINRLIHGQGTWIGTIPRIRKEER